MNPEKNINENERLEKEEQAIGEPKNVITDDFNVSQEDEERLTLEKRQEEADQAEKDEREALGEVDDSYSMQDYYKENPIM